MNQVELNEILSKKIGKSRKDVERLFSSFVDVVNDCCCNLDTIAIPRFGNIVATKNDEHIAINPVDNKKYLYPPKIDVSFSASNILKHKIKEGKNE